jgi:TonB family protein
MLNTRLDRAPIRRSSVLLVWLGMLLVSVPIAGLSITAEPAPMAPSTLASTMASQPAGAPAASAARPDATVSRPSARRPAAATGAIARQQPAALAGTVADQSGRPVPNVPVKVTDPATSATAETTTDQSGQFAVANLAPGRYDVRISKPGFKPLDLSLVVRAGETGRVQGVLQLGRVAESITVSHGPITVIPGAGTPVTPGAARARHVAPAPVDDPCAHSTEGGCITPPLKLADARPIYPANHAQANVAGEVVIDAVIRSDGSVAQLQPKPDSDPDFAAAAMHAIRLWKFSPTRLNGEPVEVGMTVKVAFQIAK